MAKKKISTKKVCSKKCKKSCSKKVNENTSLEPSAPLETLSPPTLLQRIYYFFFGP